MLAALPEPTLAIALNALLDSQPGVQERLARHGNKTLRLSLPVLPLNLTLDEVGRFAPADPGAQADLTLIPQFAALPRWFTGGQLAELFQSDGDGVLAADLAGALADFDWVLALRPYLGDIAASRFDQFIQGLSSWRNQAAESVGRNLAEYAVHEQAMLAEPYAVRDFIGEVDCLREDADRLEARLRLLEKTRDA